MIVIDDLHVEVSDKEILKGISLIINPGEVHAIMGPNGAGKSTLAKVLAGHPSYHVTKGSVTFLNQDLLEMEVSERVCQGLFLTFQYPTEIPGVSNKEFLFQCLNAQKKARGEAAISIDDFDLLMDEKLKKLNMSESFLKRCVNEGFSGGEKKRNEILQMNLFDPKFAILDETDSGLDIDSMRLVADGINSHMNDQKGILLITHYQRLLDYVKPDFVHVLIDGKIVLSGDASLATQLEEKGYDWLEVEV